MKPDQNKTFDLKLNQDKKYGCLDAHRYLLKYIYLCLNICGGGSEFLHRKPWLLIALLHRVSDLVVAR